MSTMNGFDPNYPRPDDTGTWPHFQSKPVPKDGGPAFPAEGPRMGQFECFGMSLRDYFAAKAMQAELATCGVPGEACKALVESAGRDGIDPVRKMARNAYEIADAMLAAREAQP